VGEGREPCDGKSELLSQLGLAHYRRLRLDSVRWLVLASLPLWAQARWHALPELVSWLVLLAQGCCIAAAGLQASLEHRFALHAGVVGGDRAGVVVRDRWGVWDELRSALWWSLAGACLVPWLYVGIDRPLPAPLLFSLAAAAGGILALVVGAELAAWLRAVSLDGRRAAPAAPLRGMR
jgi:hypothetical protein